MADNDWSNVPTSGTLSLQQKMLANDAHLQMTNANWPTGGTAKQLGQESNLNPNAVNPSSGALGMAQVMPDTLKSVEQQLGRTLDPHNVNDALAIHRYVMNQNLQHFGDVDDALRGYDSGWNPSKWNNTETNKYVSNFHQGIQPNDDSGWETVTPAVKPTTNDDSGWETLPQQTQSPTTAAGAFARGAEQSALPTLGGLAAFGPGFSGGAAIGSLAGPIGGLVGGLVGGVGASMGASAVVDKAQDYLLKQFPQAADALGLSPEQLQSDQSQHPIASFAGGLAPQAAALRPSMGLNTFGRAVGGLFAGGQEAVSELVHGQSLDWEKIGLSAGAGAMLDKPTMIGRKLGLHGGSEPDPNTLKAMASGNLDQSPEPMPGEFTGPPSPDQWATANQGENTPWYQTGERDALGSNRDNLRQQEFDFENPPAETPSLLMARDNGDIGTPSQIRDTQPFVDEMSRRVAEFNRTEPEQLDMFNEQSQERLDQFGPDENPRSLTPDEFQQTLENLSGKEGTRFEMPENVDEAYGKYLDTVRDDQGGLFDRPTIGKKFADLAQQEAVDRFVNEHPIVKANTDQVAYYEKLLASNPDSQTRMGAQADLQRAQETLAKSRENLGNRYKDGWTHPSADENGIVHMNMGVPIPDWIKSGLMRMLQGLHGMAVKWVDRKLAQARNLNSFGKILGNGIKQSINDARSKDWEVKKDEAAVNQIKNKSPLGKFDAIKEWIPDDRPYEQVKQDFINAPDMDSNWITKNVTSQGGVWASALSKSPIVKWAFTKINDAVKRGDFEVKRLLTDSKTGLRSTMQDLSTQEKTSIHTRMDLDEGKVMRSPNELRNMGFNDKQIAYYKRFHEVMGEVYNKFNEGRAKAGLPPVDRRVAYMASRFTGDFRSMIYQKGTKRPVGFIGHNNRWVLNQIKKQIDRQNPGKYDFEDTKLNRGPDGHISPNMFNGYLNVLNHFQLNDPEMASIMDTYRTYFTNNAAKAMQAALHAKDKQGIMGAEGRKAWQTAEINAEEGMKSQLIHADHMIRWSELQGAASEVKQMLADGDVDKANAKSYVKDYMAQALGQTNSDMSRALSSLLDGVGSMTGFGPSMLRSLNSFQKGALLRLWLGFFRIPHSLLTLTQFMQSNPAFAEMVRSRGIDVNFWKSTGKGFGTSAQLLTKAIKPGTQLSGIDQAIWEHGQRTGVMSANLTNHLTNINEGKVGAIMRHTFEANVTAPEAAIRTMTFSTWTHALHDAGMPLKEALGTAENLTRGALVDYRPTERPMVFGKMGIMGDLASTLTRFKMNQLSQHQYFAKNAINGNGITPLLTLLGSSIAFAGLSGVIGFNYADELYHGISFLAGKPDRLKGMMLRNLPDWATYGMFSQLGIDMQGSFSNADTLPDNPWANLFPTGDTLTQMAKALGSAAYYHDSTEAKKLLYNFSPTSAKGLEENYMFSKTLPNGDKAFINPNTEKLQDIRTPQEQMLRNFAFHPIKEAHDRDVRQFASELYGKGGEAGDYSSLQHIDLKRYTDKVEAGTATKEDLNELSKSWIAHKGTPDMLTKDLQNYYRDRVLTSNQRMVGGMSSNPSLTDIYRIQQMQAMKGGMK